MIGTARRFLSRHSHVNWALADQAMVSGVNFLTAILLARLLGLEEFGRFTLAWMAVLFANSLQHAMVNAPMMSIGPKQRDSEADAYYGAVFAQQAACAGLSFVVLYLGVRLSGVLFPEWRVDNLALPLAFVAFTFQMQDFLRRYFFTRGRAAAAFAIDAVSYLGQLMVLVVLFLAATIDSATALWVIAATSAVAAIIGGFGVERVAWSRCKLKATWLRHWRFSKWLAGSALMSWASGNLFIVVAGALLGAGAVGALRAAQNLMGVTHILFQGLENVVPSRGARYYSQDGRGAFVAYLRKVSWAVGLATVAVATVATAAPEFWLTLVYGEQFEAFGVVLRWYAVIYIVLALLFPLQAGLKSLENTKSIFLSYIWSSGYAVLLSYWFVDTFDIFGVFYGVLAMNMGSLLILWFGLRAALARVE